MLVQRREGTPGSDQSDLQAEENFIIVGYLLCRYKFLKRGMYPYKVSFDRLDSDNLAHQVCSSLHLFSDLNAQGA